MLDLPDPLDDPEDIDPDAPKIDADPGNMRLFVRAKKAQIEQIKKIVAGLGCQYRAVAATTRFGSFRSKANRPSKCWRRQRSSGGLPIRCILYRVRRIGPGGANRTRPRRPTGQVPVAACSGGRLGHAQRTAADLRRGNASAAAIRCQVTPRGLLMQSDDTRALDHFESTCERSPGRSIRCRRRRSCSI